MTGTTTLAEDLLLLLLDDATGRPTADSASLDYALAGALLLELALAGRIDVVPAGARRATVVVRDGDPVADDVLADVLRRVGERSRRPEQLVPALSKGLRRRLLARLAERGLVRREARRVLAVIRYDVWPATGHGVEAALRGRLRDVLVAGATPDPRTAALVALLSSINAAHRVVGELDRGSRAAVRARARAIAEDAWAAQAVQRAVRAVQAAVASGATAAVTAAIVSS